MARLISVVVPTHNRPDKLPLVLEALATQDLAPAAFELIVVDDGSEPPVELPPSDRAGVAIRLVRLPGLERSAARNAGAAVAEAPILVFVDDDVVVTPSFLGAHLAAQREWPGVLAVGRIRLTDEALRHPFGEFRQRLEDVETPLVRGLVAAPNFCAAGNMSIPAARFRQLGGFDASIASSEDQDLALRHTAAGGRIAFVPEAYGAHLDSAVDVRSYCRRSEWGAEHMVPFCRRYPDLPGNPHREMVNGPTRWFREPLKVSAKKTAKGLALRVGVVPILFALADVLERRRAGRLLDWVYRASLGLHLMRGHRRGLAVSPAPSRTGTGP